MSEEFTHTYIFTGKKCRIIDKPNHLLDRFKCYTMGHGDVFVKDEDGEEWLVNRIFLDKIRKVE